MFTMMNDNERDVLALLYSRTTNKVSLTFRFSFTSTIHVTLRIELSESLYMQQIKQNECLYLQQVQVCISIIIITNVHIYK